MLNVLFLALIASIKRIILLILRLLPRNRISNWYIRKVSKQLVLPIKI